MAVTTDDLLIKIQADTGNATQSIALLTKQLARLENSMKGIGDSTEGLNNKVSGFGAMMLSINSTIEVATRAYEILNTAIGGSIQEYKNSVDEVEKLKNTLTTLGTSGVQKVTDDFNKFADAMEESRAVNGGQVMGLINIAKAAGISDEMTKKLIKTSTDLAATGRTDLQGAFNALLKSLKGSTGALAVMEPELVNMDKKMAMAGGAVDYLGSKLDGLAENELMTFAGQAKVTALRLEKMQENIGAIIGGMFGLKPGVSVVNTLLQQLNQFLETNRESFVNFGKSIVSVFTSIGDMVKTTYKVITNIDFSRLISSITSVGVVLTAVFVAFNKNLVMTNINLALTTISNGYTALGAAISKSIVFIKANTGAWLANARAQMKAAATAGLVAAGVATTVIALDLLVRNITNIPKLFAAAFNSVMVGLSVFSSSIAGFIDLLGGTKLKEKVDAFGDSQAEAFAKNAEGLNSGLLGSALDGIDNLKAAWKAGTEEMKEDAKVDKNKPTGPRPDLPAIVSPEAIKALEELRQKNAQLDFELRSADMLQRDIIDEKYQLEQKSLIEKYKDVKLTKEGSEELKKQIELLDKKSALEQSKAPSREFESAAKPLNNVAETISKTFSGGLDGMAGMVTGMMSGASAVMDAVSGVVGFIQKLIDFIPQILNAVANIFNTLADLPLKILEGVQNVFKGMVKFVTDFIPNVLKAVPEIIYTIFKGLFVELPKAFMQLMKMLPSLILEIIKELPSMIAEVVEGMISSMPEMAITFIQTLVANAPKIVFALMRLFYVEIPKAIIRGIINGIKAIGDAIKGLFGGKGAKIDIDTKAISESMKKAARVLTGEASKLFKVTDLGGETVSQKVKDQIEAVEDAGRNARNWLLDAWKWILARFQEVIDGLLAVWRWIYDTILAPFLAALQAAWNFINENILKPLMNGLRSVFQFAQTALGYISNGIRAAFEWASNALNGAFQFLRNTFEPLVNAFQDAINKVSGAFSWVGELRESINKLASGFQWISDLADSIRKLTDWDWPDIPGMPGSGGGGGGYIGQVASKVGGAVSKAFGRANGGLIYAANGMVMPSRGTDTVPAMLTPGEFVMQRSAVNSIGLNNLQKANQTGQLPGAGNQVYNISINVDAKTAPDEKFIRGTMLPLLKEELRRASLDGQRVIFQGGIRT